MIITFDGAEYIANINFITLLKYRSCFGKSVFGKMEDTDYIQLFYIAAEGRIPMQKLLKRCADRKYKTELLYLAALIKKELLFCNLKKYAKGEPAPSQTDERDIEIVVLDMLGKAELPEAAIYYCRFDDILSMLIKKNNPDKRRMMSAQELAALHGVL